ncbi:MAG: hypothetical protein GY866_07405 [Proteobacteria bacterium]|nr:hypothetical protein [Pseudomonadota bacterium]
MTILFCLTATTHLLAEMEIDVQGELTGWGGVTDADPDRRELGIRYLPRLKLNCSISEALSADSELMANLYRTHLTVQGEETEESHDEKAYRLWIRLYTEQLEARLGLQEISFGPGRILRSLRWFDQKDSRDPTNFTDGVKALLLRYYLENNANIWIWSLYGNEDPMGISPLPPKDDAPEFGGRVQIPMGSGEMGLSVHRRQVDLNPLLSRFNMELDPLQENRAGFDLTWDLEAGIWFEVSRLELELNPFVPETQLFATFGTDYTFDIGNGVSTTLEYQAIRWESEGSDVMVLGDGTVGTLAVSFQYPLTLLDQIQFMAFLGNDTGTNSLQADWKRTYDTVMIDVVLFRTTVDETGSTVGSAFGDEPATGDETGIRLIVQFNH